LKKTRGEAESKPVETERKTANKALEKPVEALTKALADLKTEVIKKGGTGASLDELAVRILEAKDQWESGRNAATTPDKVKEARETYEAAIKSFQKEISETVGDTGALEKLAK